MATDYLDVVYKQFRRKSLVLSKEEELKIVKAFNAAGDELVKKYVKAGKMEQRFIKEHINKIAHDVNEIIEEYALEQAKLSASVNKFILDEMVDGKIKYSKKLADMFTDIPKEVVNYVTSGGLYRDGKGLSDRLWNYGTINGQYVGDIVASGVAQGKSAVNIAKDLEQFVKPEARKYWDASKQKEKLGRYYGRVEYNALRLARTTNTHASQFAQSASAKAIPYSDGVTWHSVFAHGRTCQQCMDRDGRIFKFNEIPLDHPNGMCYQTTHFTKSLEEMTDEIARWVNGEDNPILDEWAMKLGGELLPTSQTVNKVFNKDAYKVYSDEQMNPYLVKREGFSEDDSHYYGRYVAHGNSFKMNEFLYSGKYDAYIDEKATFLRELDTRLKYSEEDIARALSRKLSKATSQEEIDAFNAWANEKRVQLLSDEDKARELRKFLERNRINEKLLDEINKFTSIVDRYKLPENLTVYRNVDNNFLQSVLNMTNTSIPSSVADSLSSLKYGDSSEKIESLTKELNRKLKGVAFENKSFTSTSYQASQNVFKDRSVQMEVYADKGMTALITDNVAESEIVFNRNQKMEILGFKNKVLPDGSGVLVMLVHLI